jgi:hypothetical protein
MSSALTGNRITEGRAELGDPQSNGQLLGVESPRGSDGKRVQRDCRTGCRGQRSRRARQEKHDASKPVRRDHPARSGAPLGLRGDDHADAPFDGRVGGRRRRPRPLAARQCRRLSGGGPRGAAHESGPGLPSGDDLSAGRGGSVSLRRAAPRLRGPVSRSHVEDVGHAVGRAVPSPWDRHGGGRQLHTARRRPGVHRECRRLGRAPGGRRV